MERKIYLIRHLATDYNQKGIFMGRSFDMPIKKSNIAKFHTTIKKIEWDTQFEFLISSPSLRCKQTLEILRESFDLKNKILVNPCFQETNYGNFEGRSVEEIKNLYPNELNKLTHKPSKVKLPQGETFLEVQERSYSELIRIMSETTKSIIICTHVDIIKMILFKVLHISIDMKRYLHIDNGSISILEDSKEGIKIKLVNLT